MAVDQHFFGKRGQKPKSFIDKISQHTEIDDNGCWNWGGSRSVYGYGVVWHNGKGVYAHRLSYLTFMGELSDRLVIDHLCRNRKCINPEHLEEVTDAENVARGIHKGVGRPRPKAEYCKRGHEFTKENTYVYRNRQNCRECKKYLYHTRYKLVL
jgi:hypothetical protein